MTSIFTNQVRDEAQDVRPEPRGGVRRAPEQPVPSIKESRTKDDILRLNQNETNYQNTRPTIFPPAFRAPLLPQRKKQGVPMDSNTGTAFLKVKQNPDARVDTNPLNGYIMVQYHVSLTMLHEDEAKRIQGVIPTVNEVDTDQNRNEPKYTRNVTIARTGDTLTSVDTFNFIDPVTNSQNTPAPNPVTDLELTQTGRSSEVLPRKNYYLIQSVKIDRVYAPSEVNPLIRVMTRMKMQIVEPHGFKLHEDIRNLAKALSYDNINTGRILYQVDIHFRGYDPDTGQWVNKIPISPNPDVPSTVTYYVAISRIEATVSNRGTVYEVDMVPAGHYAYRPEEVVVAANHIFTGESSTFGDFLTNLGRRLSEAKSAATREVIKRTYKFYAPKILRDSSFRAQEFGRDHNFIKEKQDGGGLIIVGKDVDLMTMLSQVLADLKVARDLFVNEGDKAFLTPRVHWGIRYNTKYVSKANTALNDYDEVVYEYVIEPFLTFKKGTVTSKTISDYVNPSNQLKRVAQILSYNMLIRIYNYIYTGENTETIDFNIKLKTFYYATLNETNDSSQLIGTTSTESSGKSLEERTERSQQRASEIQLDQIFSPGQQADTLERLFGNINLNGSVTDRSNLSAYDRLGGGFGVTPDSLPNTAILSEVSSEVDKKITYMNYLDDHIKNDLLVLEGFKIRGDPIWLLSPYATADLDGLEAELSDDIRITPRTSKVIFLRMFAPDQNDMMSPQLSRASNSMGIIGGFYEVTTTTSVFENGQFTQELNGVKMNHLNFVEEMFDAVPPPRLNVPTSSRVGAVQNEPQDGSNNGITPGIFNTPDGGLAAP